MFFVVFYRAGLLLTGLFLFCVFPVAGNANDAVPTPKEKPSKVVIIDTSKSSTPVPPHKPEAIKRSQSPIVIKEDIDLPSLKFSQASKIVFPERQARLYREIFELQDKGKNDAADQIIAQLSNSVLIGHVYAQRYLHPDYKASYAELSRWMENCADHPQARKIYNLALSRQPLGLSQPLVTPQKRSRIKGNLVALSKKGKAYKSSKKRSGHEAGRVAKLHRDISRHVERREPTLALNILNNDYALQFMDDIEYDRLRALIASGYFYAGKFDKAKNLADASINRSGSYVPLAGWVQGLVNWQKADYTKSSQGFGLAATSPYASGWMVSAAAYWASRANMRAGNVEVVSRWLNISAMYPRTFYGLIAARALGHDIYFNWRLPSLTRAHVKYIEATKHGKRASALLRVGRADLAELELDNLSTDNDVQKQQALLAYAHHNNLSSLSIKLGNAFNNPNGDLYDAALYPVPSWQPQGGFRISPALIHAIARQESRFNVAAQNPSGATGLMQLMPATANYIAGNSIYEEASGRYELKKPEINLEIGQTYIERLLDHKAVNNDLLSLAIAYNAGPGNLSRWKEERSQITDPLLFIESIPYNETRAFVERVLSNYWIYQMRMSEEPTSLDAVAEGRWARYQGRQTNHAELASR